MKKFIVLILSVLFLVCLTACSSNTNQLPSTSEAVKNTDTKDNSQSKKYEIGDIILSDGSVVKNLDTLDSGIHNWDDSSVPEATATKYSYKG